MISSFVALLYQLVYDYIVSRVRNYFVLDGGEQISCDDNGNGSNGNVIDDEIVMKVMVTLLMVKVPVILRQVLLTD